MPFLPCLALFWAFDGVLVMLGCYSWLDVCMSSLEELWIYYILCFVVGVNVFIGIDTV